MAGMPPRPRHPARALRSAGRSTPSCPVLSAGRGAQPGAAPARALPPPAAAAAGFSSATTWAPPAAHAPAAAAGLRAAPPRHSAPKSAGAETSRRVAVVSASSSLPCLCRERAASRDLPNCQGTRANPGASK